MSIKRKIRLLATCVAIIGLLAACGDNNVPGVDPNHPQLSPVSGQPTGDSQSNSSISGGQATVSNGNPNAADSEKIERTLPAGGSREFKYASLEIKVATGVITNQLSANPPTYNPDQAQLKLELAIANPTKETVSLNAALFQVKLGNGTSLSQPLELTLQPLDTKPFELDFNVPVNTTWDGTQLELNQEDKEPALLALTGPQTNVITPIDLKAGTEVKVKDPKVTYTLTSASLDLDAQGERVSKGNYYLVLNFLVTNNDNKYEAYVGDDNFRLSIDGGPSKSPEKTDPVAEGVKELGSQEFALAFTIPQDARDLSLEVGEVGKDTATIKLDLTPTATQGTPGTAATSPAPALSPSPATKVVAPK